MGIGRYFDEISQDTGKYCFGVDDTLKALEMGAVETLICWENLDIQRVTLKNHASGEEKILFLNSEQEIITDRSQEGSQYVRGFGGIGGMLRYTVDFQSMQCDNLDDADYDLDDY